MLRRNLLKSLAVIIPASLLLTSVKLQKPFRTKLNEFADGTWYKQTYDSNGNRLTYKNSGGYWNKATYNSDGEELTYENSTGFWCKYTYDANGRILAFEDSTGYSTYDSHGKQLTFEKENHAKT